MHERNRYRPFSKRTRDRDRVRHYETPLVGEVRKPTISQIPPELAGAELGGEVDIGETVAIDIGGTDAIPWS